MIWTFDRLRPKDWKGQPVKWKQVKYNGHRLTLFVQPNGKLTAYGRDLTLDPFEVRYPWVRDTDWWRAVEKNAPPHTAIDGELHLLLDSKASRVAHALVDNPDDLTYTAFAVPWHSGVSAYDCTVTFGQNFAIALGLRYAFTYKVLPEDTCELMQYDATNLNIEGWVLKNANYQDWWKLKPDKDPVDLVVTGFKDGKGKFLGAVGSLICSATIDGVFRVVASVSGMDDETRWDIDEDADLGRVVEVKYTDIGDNGKLIHPRFVQWRDDKPANECCYCLEDL